MKLQVFRNGNDIVTNKDYSNIKDIGEVAHFLCEIEVIKEELLKIWKEMQNEYHT